MTPYPRQNGNPHFLKGYVIVQFDWFSMWYSFLDTSSLLCMNAISHKSCSPQGSPFSKNQTTTEITHVLIPSCINTPGMVTVLNAKPPSIIARYSSFLYYSRPRKLLEGNVSLVSVCLFTGESPCDHCPWCIGPHCTAPNPVPQPDPPQDIKHGDPSPTSPSPSPPPRHQAGLSPAPILLVTSGGHH